MEWLDKGERTENKYREEWSSDGSGERHRACVSPHYHMNFPFIYNLSEDEKNGLRIYQYPTLVI